MKDSYFVWIGTQAIKLDNMFASVPSTYVRPTSLPLFSSPPPSLNLNIYITFISMHSSLYNQTSTHTARRTRRSAGHAGAHGTHDTHGVQHTLYATLHYYTPPYHAALPCTTMHSTVCILLILDAGTRTIYYTTLRKLSRRIYTEFSCKIKYAPPFTHHLPFSLALPPFLYLSYPSPPLFLPFSSFS